MNKLLGKIQALHLRRQQRSLQLWEQERTKGKARFVLRTGLTIGVSIVAVTDILEHLFDSAPPHSDLLFRLLWYTGAGLIGGVFAWNRWEEKYERALQQARTASLSGH